MMLKLSPVLQIYDLLMLNYVEDDDAMFRYHSRCHTNSVSPFASPGHLLY